MLLAWLGACAAGPAATTPTIATDGPALRGAVQALVDPAVCTADADCHTLAIGHKACGGPEAYLAWSARATDAAALQAAAARYNAWQQAAVSRDGRASTCEFVTDPGALCAAAGGAGSGAGVCQLRTRSGRGAPSSR